MSDRQKNTENDEPAVSRLLNILRSQRGENSAPKEEEQKVTSEEIEDRDVAENEAVSDRMDETPSDMASSILVRLKEIEDKKGAPDPEDLEEQKVESQEEQPEFTDDSSILAKVDPNIPDSASVDGTDSDTSPEEVAASEEEISDGNDASEDLQSEENIVEEDSVEQSEEEGDSHDGAIDKAEEEIPSLLDDNIFTEQSQERVQGIQDDIIESKSDDAIREPVAFDTSLYSNYDFGDASKTFEDYYNNVLNIFNESTRKLTFHIGSKRLRFMMIKTGIGENIIEKYGILTLPYKVEDSDIVINDMQELVTYILDNMLTEEERKIAYGAVYNNYSRTKSLVFQIPQLKGKEAKDLIAWQIKKNSGGGDDQVISYDVAPIPWDKNKKNVVVGTCERSAIRRDLQPFKKKKIKLRLNSTVSILLWKLFIHNYPDRKDGTYVLVHIGEKATNLIVVKDSQMIFVRDISIGASDLYKSIQQRIVTGDKAIEVDAKTAERIFRDYGVPLDTHGIAGDTGISLYKLSILIRPTIERLTSELTRSLSFFKKENPDYDPQEILFAGTGASLPNLVRSMENSFDVPVSLINPMRAGNYTFAEGVDISPALYPDLDMNFALSLNESGKPNVLPDHIVNNFKFIFPMKVAMGLAAFLIPFFIGTAILSKVQISKLRTAKETRQAEWNLLQEQLGDYTYMLNDIKYLTGFETYLSNDYTHSENALKMLRFASEEFPDGFKIINLKLSEERDETYLSNPGALKNFIEITGFLQADPSVSNIHFTNFILKLEALDFRHEVEYETRASGDGAAENMLNYTIKLRY